MTWRVYLGQTMTGIVGPSIAHSTGNAEIPLNDIESMSATFNRSELVGVERSWWSPWAGALLVSYEDEYIEETLIAAGPIDKPVKDTPKTGKLEISAGGIGALLSHREVLAGDFRPGQEEALKLSVLDWSGVSLGSIVGRIITAATSKRAGWLPIVIPPEEPAVRQRTYEGWNVANNLAWKRITEITEVIDGPDVMLRPRFVAGSNRTRFEWVLYTGTEAQPTIPQTAQVLWDSTAQQSPIANVEVTSNATRLAHRVYATGAGEGAGIALQIAEAKTIPEYMPLLETTISDTDTENLDLLRSKATSTLASQGIDQVTFTVESTAESPIGSWNVGDAVDATLTGWLNIPDGTYTLRIISAKYDLTNSTVTVECQEDQLGEELTW